MREKQGRGGDGETHKGGTEKRTTFGTDGQTDGRTDRQTDRGTYRSGAHLKMSQATSFPLSSPKYPNIFHYQIQILTLNQNP